MKGFITAKQLKMNILEYAYELINMQQLAYEEYAARINLHITAVNTRNADTEVEESLRDTFLEVLAEVLPEEFYNEAKEPEIDSSTSRNSA